MQGISKLALLAGLAATATANGNAYGHLHRRVNNGTLTTATVYDTQVHTITSCAPEVTDCPARP
ncbi:hypothetical protein KC331_g21600, partial [Hortaea werneckii]